MNHVYKTVFNKSTQTWMAVCEYARSVGCGSASGGSKSVTRGVVGSITFLSFAVLMALQSAHANTPTTIIADKSADKALQPIVLNTASGVVSVNIATPNARGLSNNHYSQFDVGSTGAVLNNNRKAVGTQIAGFVAANPYMARGEASTILNQVNSNNPSHLGGFIEVAGKKADVIIANPSGLVVNGAGFINAGNVHLTAANSQVNQGQVTGYEVGTGHIATHGKLNLQGTDYAALIAKAVQINDEIYAGDKLDVITGENQVSLQDGNFNQLSAVHQNNGVSSTSQQGVALDISNLGGMYAGKIHLIGTDKGFGVNNQGVITATGSGQPLGTGTLTLDSQGNLVNTGKILAKDAVTINTHDNTTQNNGTLLSEQADIAIHTASLNNTGIIHSTQTAKIAAKEAIENRGSVYGGVLQVHTDKLDNTGQLIQTGTGKLDITTDTLINTDKAVIGQSLYGQTTVPAPSTPSSDQSAGSIRSELADNTAGSTGNVGADPQPPALSDSGANTQTKPIPTARGHIIATNGIHNTGDQALITATGDIGISANQTSNTKQASIDVQSLNTNTLVNTDSKIALDEINWQLTRFDNSKGSITARNGMVIDSGSDMINTGGQLSAADAVALSAVGVLDNTQGVITSGGDLTAASSDVVNHKGLIVSNKGATLTTTNTLDNTQGKILSSHSITIDTKDFTNKGEVLAKTVLVQAQTDIHHAEDDILTADNLSLATKGNITNRDKLVASSEITLQAANIDNANIAIVSAPKASIHADNTITNLGLIHANDLAIDANTVKNLGARIYGGEVAITADAVLNQGGDKGAAIAAQKDLVLAVNTLTNTHGDSIHQTATDNAWILSQGTLSIHGKDGKDSKANELTNLGSRIESAGDMLLSAKNINNTNAKFASTIQKVAGSEQYKEYIIPEHLSTKIDMASLEWRPWSRANYLTYKGAGDLSTNLDNLGSAPIASVYSCQNDDEDSCGINYAPDSAVWQHFGIQAPSPMPVIEKVLEEPKLPENETEESCTKADASNTACIAYNKALAEYSKALKPLIDWEEANKPQLDALDAAISDYNAKFGSPEFKNFTLFKVTEHQEQSVVTASAPAQIISGGNLDFDADTIINDKSQIIAGGKIVFDSDSLKNIDAKGEHHTIENGTAQYTRSRWRGGFKRYHQRDWAGVAPFATTLKKSITLPVTAWQENASSDTLADYGQTKPNTGNVAIDVNLGNLPNTDVVNTAPISLPNSALYIINADDPNLPLVQTDPAFTDYKQWLSSDYMLKALQSDPNYIHKRLYDGFAEQKIIQDAYYQLTGRHINTDYQNQEVAYQALMDNGITYAKQFNLTFGVALTPAQMASLTTDMVWLVKQPITVVSKDKDGNSITKTIDALAPKLYLRSANSATGTLTPDGRYAAMSSKSMDLQLTGNLDNNGNIIAKDTANINANNVTNDGGVYGNFVAVTVDNTIANHGTMYANSAMRLDAGNQIINESQTATHHNKQGQSASSNTAITRIATIRVGDGLKDQTDEQGNPLTTLNIQAGNYVLNKAANIQNDGGNTQITAQNGINITTLTTSNHISAVADPNNYFNYSQSTDVGSTITSAGNLTIATTGKGAGINIQGSHLNATGTTALIATGDISITEGRATQSLDTASKFTDKGLVSKKTTQTAYQMDSNTSIQSTVGGETVLMKSGGDMQIVATKVLADRDVTLVSDGKISIDAGVNHQTIHQQSAVKKSGLVDISPTSVTIGRQTTDQTNKAELKTHTGSTVAALGGDVTIVANQSYQQTGSDVLAFKPDNTNAQTIQARTASEGGNVDIFARSINVENATDSQTTTNDFRFKQSGVSVSVSNPVVDLGMQAYNMYQAAEQTDDERSKRLAALSVAGDGWMTWSEYQEQKTQVNNPNRGEKGNNTLTDFKVAATIGSQSSQANSISYQESNKASSVKAENITLHAFGDNDGDINIVGSQVISKDNTSLLANNDINILSSTQLKYSDSDNKNHSAGVGAYVSVGADTSFGFTASGGVGRGNTDSNGETQTNSQVLAGNLLILDSANDTNIKGATAKAEQVIARAGGDLNIHSRSDNYQLEGKQRQYGGSINVSLGAKMPVSGSVSAELGDSQVNYQAVREQSGIYAGKGGFDIAVGGNTDLLGAVIASDATRDKNRLTTTAFSSANITNISEAESTVKSYGIDSQAFSGNFYPLAKTIIANTVGNQGSDVNHHETSQTISAIADGELVAKDADSQARLNTISHDTANAHRYIAPANIDEMMADAKAQQFIKDATVDTLFKYSDEAHRKMFIAEAPLYRVTKDEKGNFVYTQIEGEEKKNLLSEKDTSPRVFTNGIFNGIEAAGKYAIQNRRDKNAELGQELDLDKNPIYFVHFPKTNNFLSEMMVAAYQKYLESDTLGLTNATQEIKSIIKERGSESLQIDGHSRGTLTITNAYSSLLNDGDAGKYSNLRTNMVGAAANVKNADDKLAELQGRNGEVLSTDPMNDTAQFKPAYTEAEKSDMSIHVQGHAADPVHGVIGFNSSTGGTTKPNNVLGVVKEAFNSVLGKETTAHNCYGVGKTDCGQLGLLKNNEPMTWEPVYKPKQDTTPTTPQNPSLCTNSSSTDKQKCNNTN